MKIKIENKTIKIFDLSPKENIHPEYKIMYVMNGILFGRIEYPSSLGSNGTKEYIAIRITDKKILDTHWVEVGWYTPLNKKNGIGFREWKERILNIYQ